MFCACDVLGRVPGMGYACDRACGIFCLCEGRTRRIGRVLGRRGSVCVRVDRVVRGSVLQSILLRSRHIPDAGRLTGLCTVGPSATTGNVGVLISTKVLCGGEKVKVFIDSKTGRMVEAGQGTYFY